MRIYIAIIYIVFFFSQGAVATTGDASLWQTTYPTSTTYTNFNCNICHANINMNPLPLNGYGSVYKNQGRNASSLQGIETMDSDGDTEMNVNEISGGSNPGSASSTSANVPVPPTTTGGGQSKLDSNSGSVTDFENANMLSQTSCTTVKSFGKNGPSNRNSLPPGNAVLLLPFFVLIILKKSLKLVRA